MPAGSGLAEFPGRAGVGGVDDDSFVKAFGLVRTYARAADFLGKQARDGEGLVADLLGGQADAWAAGEQAVLRITGVEFG